MSLVWSDARTHKIVSHLKERYATENGVDRFRSITGLPISTYFSAIKLRWLISNVPEVERAVKEKRALFGTIDTWVMWVRYLAVMLPCNALCPSSYGAQ